MTLTRRILWAMTLSYWVVLFVLTHTPPVHMPPGPGNDKLMHFLAYLVLAFLLGTTLYLALPGQRPRIALLVLVLGAGYGAFDELTQPLSGRDAEWGDWFCDVAGVTTVALVLFVLVRLFPPGRGAQSPG